MRKTSVLILSTLILLSISGCFLDKNQAKTQPDTQKTTTNSEKAEPKDQEKKVENTPQLEVKTEIEALGFTVTKIDLKDDFYVTVQGLATTEVEFKKEFIEIVKIIGEKASSAKRAFVKIIGSGTFSKVYLMNLTDIDALLKNDLTTEEFFTNLAKGAETKKETTEKSGITNDDMTDKSVETADDSTEKTANKTPGENTTEPQETVKKYYDALLSQNFGIAKDLMTEELKNVDPLSNDAFSVGYRILDQKIYASEARVYVSDDLTDYEGVTATREFVYQLKLVNGLWKINHIVDKELENEILGEPEKVYDDGTSDASETRVKSLQMANAKIVVTDFLNGYRYNEIDLAKSQVTQNFLDTQGEGFFLGMDSGAFISFELLDVTEADGGYWVKVKEDWISGPDTVKYKVIVLGDGSYIDEIRYEDLY